MDPTQPKKGSVAGKAAKSTAIGTLKIIAFLLNFFIPGAGTLLLGRIGTGIIQLVLLLVGFIAIAVGGIGFIIILADWVWALVTVVQFGKKPQQIIVVQQPPPDQSP